MAGFRKRVLEKPLAADLGECFIHASERVTEIMKSTEFVTGRHHPMKELLTCLRPNVTTNLPLCHLEIFANLEICLKKTNVLSNTSSSYGRPLSIDGGGVSRSP